MDFKFLYDFKNVREAGRATTNKHKCNHQPLTTNLSIRTWLNPTLPFTVRVITLEVYLHVCMEGMSN